MTANAIQGSIRCPLTSISAISWWSPVEKKSDGLDGEDTDYRKATLIFGIGRDLAFARVDTLRGYLRVITNKPIVLSIFARNNHLDDGNPKAMKE